MLTTAPNMYNTISHISLISLGPGVPKLSNYMLLSGHTEHLLLVYCVLANEPPLYLRRKKLSMQYCLKLSATSQNPAYSAVFAGKCKSFFDNKPNQIPTQPDLRAIGFKQRNTLQCSMLATSPWLFSHPCVNFDLHRFYKDDTAPDIFRSMFYEICASYDNFDHICTEGSKMGDRVSVISVVVFQFQFQFQFQL